jgi:hypothetical protein
MQTKSTKKSLLSSLVPNDISFIIYSRLFMYNFFYYNITLVAWYEREYKPFQSDISSVFCRLAAGSPVSEQYINIIRYNSILIKVQNLNSI